MTHLGCRESLQCLKQQVIKTAQICVNLVSSMIIKSMLKPKGLKERGEDDKPCQDLALSSESVAFGYAFTCQKLRLQVYGSGSVCSTPAAQLQKNKRPDQKMGKDLNRHFSKEDIRTANKHRKDAQHHSLSEKCKSKPQRGTISRRSGWLLSKSLQAINAGEGVEKREPLTLLVGMQTSTATMENSVEIS